MFRRSYRICETRTSFRCPSLLVCAVFYGLQKAEHIAHGVIKYNVNFSTYCIHVSISKRAEEKEAVIIFPLRFVAFPHLVFVLVL